MSNMRRFMERLIIDDMIKDSLIKQGEYKGEKKATMDERIIDHKREYRHWLKSKDKYPYKYLYPGINGNGYGEIVNGGGDGDSFWQKIFFNGERWTDEEIKEFIEANWVSAKPSQYDCTGQTFTWAIDCFNVPSGVVCYIRYAMDV